MKPDYLSNYLCIWFRLGQGTEKNERIVPWDQSHVSAHSFGRACRGEPIVRETHLYPKGS